ncbi:CBD9-like protein [Rhizoclosmatium globosum]|uniref:CBD9-like protein n=1 Tax=Rhizoclosmatium globosum TaxID=329046 RepID=A0A1Y2CEL0_9FUNG|nr:CBD9-like protein [Rhizoclosmatium globosum]|eukprot:ORY45500.1 CBD9-like protein [Rhizoclosmatium globosum]
MMYDHEYLYFGCEMEEPHVWTNITEKNSVIYWQNDWEIFIDPDGDGLNYYEFEINALNTIWELTLDKPYSKGGSARHPTNIDGLFRQFIVEVAIPWKGSSPFIPLEILINIVGLKKYNTNPPTRSTPPNIGDIWRINFSRVQWPFRIDEETGKYIRLPENENRWDIHYEDNWSWAPQGEISMHKPEMWGFVTFVGDQMSLILQE